MFGLSIMSDDKLSVVWTRQVNNIIDESENSTWHAFGYGEMQKAENVPEGC